MYYRKMRLNAASGTARGKLEYPNSMIGDCNQHSYSFHFFYPPFL